MKNLILFLISVILISVTGCGNNSNNSKEESVATPKVDLHAAIYLRDHEAIKQHIAAGSDLNAAEPSRQSSPLITAAALGESEAAILLVDAGADMNYKNMDGSTALITAIVFGNTDVAKVLINGGADLTIKNLEGSTPLHVSSFFCRKEIVKTLLEKGADKTLTNNNGNTPLQIVEFPFEDIKPIYDAVGKGLKPLGIELDYNKIRTDRPLIAKMLK